MTDAKDDTPPPHYPGILGRALDPEFAAEREFQKILERPEIFIPEVLSLH